MHRDGISGACDNAVLTEMLSKIVARFSLVMSFYEEERKDDCGADHHRPIVSALRAKDLAEARELMDPISQTARAAFASPRDRAAGIRS